MTEIVLQLKSGGTVTLPAERIAMVEPIPKGSRVTMYTDDADTEIYDVYEAVSRVHNLRREALKP